MSGPVYKVPFDCAGGKYRPTTYPGHSAFSLDWNAIDGTDFGDPVHAMLGGKVYEVVASNGQIKTRDSAGYEGWYAHLSQWSVQVGSVVAQGQVIGKIGNSGTGSTGPHLHTNSARNGKQTQQAFDGIPLACSVNPNTKYRSGPLFDCHGLFTPQPIPVPPPVPEVKHMRLGSVTEAGYSATLKPGAVIEDAAGVRLGTATLNAYVAFGKTPGGRLAIAFRQGAEVIEAYVKPDGVVTVTPPSDDAAKKAGRAAMQAEAVLAVSGLQP